MLKGEENLDLLSVPQKIIITTHHKPDGDALGSSLALYHWLKGKGHEVQIIVPSDYPSFLQWLPGDEHILQFPGNIELSKKLISEAAIIFCLDFSALSRIMQMADLILNAPGQKWMIDHHLNPEGFADLMYWDNNAAATAQLVYKFIAEVMHDESGIDATIATCLYTGILTDTGSFRFRATSAEVHTIASKLIGAGAKNWEIHENIYNTSTENRLKFIGYCLSECLEVIPAYNTAFFKISREVLQKFNIATGDTEGLVNYALSIKGVRLAALIVDRTELIKLSLRSVGDVPCNEICQRYFDGGGHLNASGGSSSDSFENVVEKFKSILSNYKEILTT